jgi:hypothetical protein
LSLYKVKNLGSKLAFKWVNLYRYSLGGGAAEMVECTVGEGEAVYFPDGW